MLDIMNDLLMKVENIYEIIIGYFGKSPISTFFFVFILGVIVLNIIKRIFIYIEKKRGTLDKKCIYLITGNGGQDCSLLSRRKYFKKKGSCEKCPGKSFGMTDAEAEDQISKGFILKHIIVVLANYSKSVLPYISFLYTLAIAIFENNK